MSILHPSLSESSLLCKVDHLPDECGVQGSGVAKVHFHRFNCRTFWGRCLCLAMTKPELGKVEWLLQIVTAEAGCKPALPNPMPFWKHQPNSKWEWLWTVGIQALDKMIFQYFSNCLKQATAWILNPDGVINIFLGCLLNARVIASFFVVHTHEVGPALSRLWEVVSTGCGGEPGSPGSPCWARLRGGWGSPETLTVDFLSGWEWEILHSTDISRYISGGSC